MDEAKEFADNKGFIYLELTAKDHFQVEEMFNIGANLIYESKNPRRIN
jgi:hypothetical protein